jgi:hypothetical protein
MKKYILVTVIALILSFNANAWATTITGSITGPTGLFGTDGWYEGTTLSWSITDNLQSNPGHYEYTYTFTVHEKPISHMIIQVSNDFTASDILEGTTSGWQLNTYSIDGPGNSNPGIPSPLYGLKWDTSGDPLTFSVTIVTDRIPMDGNFYARDGVENPKDGDKFMSMHLAGAMKGVFRIVSQFPTRLMLPSPSQQRCFFSVLG